MVEAEITVIIAVLEQSMKMLAQTKWISQIKEENVSMKI